MTKDARLLFQLIVGLYRAFIHIIDVNRTNVKKMKGITHLYCLVIDRVDSVYSKPNTDEHDDGTRSPSR